MIRQDQDDRARSRGHAPLHPCGLSKARIVIVKGEWHLADHGAAKVPFETPIRVQHDVAQHLSHVDGPPLVECDELLVYRGAHHKSTGRTQVMVIGGVQCAQYLEDQGPRNVLQQVHYLLARSVDCPFRDIRTGPTGVDTGCVVCQEGLR